MSDGVSAVTYGAGCGVVNSADELSNAVVAEVPLGAEYVLDVTAIRFIRSNTTAQLDSGYYCESPFEEIPMKYVNPACYAIVSDSHELISASVIEPNGNALSSQTAFWIDGSSNDVQRFRFRSHAYGQVQVSFNSPPCYGTSNLRALLTVRSP